MASNLITTKELYNVRVMGGKNATKRIGKVRAFVYHPKERRCIGIMVKRPDLLWMFHRKDLFVSLDGFEFEDVRVVLSDDSKTRDKAACKAIDVRLDDCVIWGGMPVVTESGATLGTVGVVTFSLVTGKVESFLVDTGATANALLGTRSVPGDLVLGFRRGIGCALAGEYEGSDVAASEIGEIRRRPIGRQILRHEFGRFAWQASKRCEPTRDDLFPCRIRKAPQIGFRILHRIQIAAALRLLRACRLRLRARLRGIRRLIGRRSRGEADNSEHACGGKTCDRKAACAQCASRNAHMHFPPFPR